MTHFIIITSAVWLLFACEAPEFGVADPTGVSGLSRNGDAQAVGSEDGPRSSQSTQPIAAPSGDMKTEKVDVPTSISGAYLSCVYEPNPSAQVEQDDKVVYCAIRMRDSNAMSDIYAMNMQINWKLELDADIQPVMKITPLLNHRDYHVKLEFIQLRGLEASTMFGQGIIAVEFSFNTVAMASARSAMMPLPYSWMAFKGGIFPSTSVIGGSECGGTNSLAICRIAVGTALYPGKLVQNLLDPFTPTRCLTTSAERPSMYSETNGLPAANMPTQVLVVPKREDESSLTWVKAQAGLIPPSALAAGHDEAGKLLYLCRNIDNASAPPEALCLNYGMNQATPGYIAEGSRSCVHEFYGAQRSSENYEVLVVKKP